MIDLEQLRADTPATQAQTFLNSAGASLMPRPVVRALHDYIDLEAAIGGYAAQAKQADALEGVYGSVARLINAQAQEIALLPSATVAWQMAFYSLPLKAGDVVLCGQTEYGANYVALLQMRERIGIRIEVVPSCPEAGQIDLLALKRLMTPEVKLVMLTWVPTNGGLVNPAAEVGRIARAHGVPYLLDACQAVGQMPVDVQALGCDMMCATGRKFLRAPRGTGFLYVRRDFMNTLVPHTIDHYSALWTSAQGYTLRDDARRYETWEFDCAARRGLGVAVDYALWVGLETIEARCRELADYLRSGLEDIAGVTVHDLGVERCAIVTFSLNSHDATKLVVQAARQGITMGVSVPASTRLDATQRQLPDLLRASPHYFNTQGELDVLLAFVRAA